MADYVAPSHPKQARYGIIDRMSGLKDSTLRIADVDLAQLASEGGQWAQPGGWVLSVNVIVTIPPPGIGPLPFVPLICKLTMGSGASRIVAVVSAFPGFEIVVPAMTLLADIMWDDQLPADLPGPLSGRPEEIQVQSIVQRGYTTHGARRSIVLPFTATPAPAGFVNIPIPPFAQRFRFQPRYGDPRLSYRTAIRMGESEFSGTDLVRALRRGEWLMISQGSTHLQFDNPTSVEIGNAAFPFGAVEFEVVL